jgi:RND family efflux transporter MFP subunit
MIKRFIIAILALSLVFGGIAWFNWFRDQMIKAAFAPKDPPPATVSTARAAAESWRRKIEAIGTLQAIQSVNVAAQISGVVKEIAFEAGQRVNKGDVLVKLDDNVLLAELRRLEAIKNMSVLTYDRQRQLNEKQFSAQATVDQAKATLDQNDADISRTRALIDQKTIRAPFTGELGVRMVNLGQYVDPGTKMVGLQSLDALYANLNMPEQRVAQLRVGQDVRIWVDAFKDKEFMGKITTIDPQLDQNNRTVLVQVTVPNTERLLRPGMFASGEVLLDRKDEVVTVPKTAIDFSLYGDSVYVVTVGDTDASGNTVRRVERRQVTLGDQHGERIAVTGLKANEEVVTAGQIKLRNNAPIVIDNTIALKPMRELLLK